MPWRRTPTWILLGGAWLALAAGYVNAVGYLGVAQRGLSHVTGQLTHLAIEVTQREPAAATSAALLVLSFFAGAAAAGLIVRHEALMTHGGRYGAALVVEAVLLTCGAALLPSSQGAAESLIAAAMGLQNGLATSYSGAVVRTTHVTGLATDLGLLVGRALRGDAVEWARLRLQATLFCSFAVGAGLGAWAFGAWGRASLFVPAGALGLAAIVWFVRSVSAASPSR